MEALVITPHTTEKEIESHTNALANTGCHELSQLFEPIFTNWERINTMISTNSRPFQGFYDVKEREVCDFTNNDYGRLYAMMARLDLISPPKYIIRADITKVFGFTIYTDTGKISEVPGNTYAFELGIRPGMKITRFNREDVSSGSEFLEKLRSLQGTVNANGDTKLIPMVLEYAPYVIQNHSETLETTNKHKKDYFKEKVEFYLKQSRTEKNKIIRWLNQYNFEDVSRNGKVDFFQIYTNRKLIGSMNHMVQYHILAVKSLKEFAQDMMNSYENGNYYTWRHYWACLFGLNYNLDKSKEKLEDVYESLLDTSLLVEPNLILRKHKTIDDKLKCIESEYGKYLKQRKKLKNDVEKYMEVKKNKNKMLKMVELYNEAIKEHNGDIECAVEQVRMAMLSQNDDGQNDENDTKDMDEFETLVDMGKNQIAFFEKKTLKAIDDLYSKFNI